MTFFQRSEQSLIGNRSWMLSSLSNEVEVGWQDLCSTSSSDNPDLCDRPRLASSSLYSSARQEPWAALGACYISWRKDRVFPELQEECNKEEFGRRGRSKDLPASWGCSRQLSTQSLCISRVCSGFSEQQRSPYSRVTEKAWAS